jgi:hypothetical protein
LATVKLDPPALLKRINDWDSQHAILMSRDTSNCCDAFRHKLVEVVHKGRVPGPADRFSDLRRLAQDLEHALRTDLGVKGFNRRLRPKIEEGW